MSILAFLKKLGGVVKWPVTHAKMLVEFFESAEKDFPQTRTALVGLVDKFEQLGPEVVAAIAADGFNVADDIKVAADLKGLFGYVKDTVYPTVEQDYTDFKLDEGGSSGPVPVLDPAPAAPAVSDDTGSGLAASPDAAVSAEPQRGPGLQAVVAQ